MTIDMQIKCLRRNRAAMKILVEERILIKLKLKKSNKKQNMKKIRWDKSRSSRPHRGRHENISRYNNGFIALLIMGKIYFLIAFAFQ